MHEEAALGEADGIFHVEQIAVGESTGMPTLLESICTSRSLLMTAKVPTGVGYFSLPIEAGNTPGSQRGRWWGDGS